MLLTGRWDQLELEEQAYVVVMGLDKGASGMVDVTFQIANPQVGSTDKGSAQNEPPSDTVTFSTPDILSAKDIANSIVTRTISFSHLRTIIVGEELAKSSFFHHVIRCGQGSGAAPNRIWWWRIKEREISYTTTNRSWRPGPINIMSSCRIAGEIRGWFLILRLLVIFNGWEGTPCILRYTLRLNLTR